MNFFRILMIPAALLGSIFLSDCRKDPVLKDADARLEFSADTVLFDTVFSTVGSVTHWMLVKNPYKKKLNIEEIRLGKSTSSQFRVNVNGQAGTVFKNVKIPPKDSIFIFIEVTVDPLNANAPMVISDSILFETNGNLQVVQLAAWGRDAHFHTPIKGTFIAPPTFCNEVWNKDKPHVIYGYFFVDSSCSLTLMEGTQVHIHGNSGMLVYTGGSLKIKGTMAEPVVIQGDRLDAGYEDEPGQWDRIWLFPGSLGNVFDYAVIKNGNVGVQADTFGVSGKTLVMNNTIIKNMAGAALFTQGAKVEANNCVFANCGIHNVLLSVGGEYDFRNCTFGNFWNVGSRSTPLLGMSNYYEASDGSIQIRNLDRAYFGNCIFNGAQAIEVGFDYKSSGLFNYQFEYCVMKEDSNVIKERILFPSKFTEIVYDSVWFVNPSTNDYSLRDGSPGLNKGSNGILSTNPVLASDILGIFRSTEPEPGAYEKP